MLHRNGNPTARNLGVIIKSIAEDLGIKPRVKITGHTDYDLIAEPL
jgi:flagellar motor protein MotB